MKRLKPFLAILTTVLVTSCKDKPGTDSSSGQPIEVSVAIQQENLPEGEILNIDFSLSRTSSRATRIYYRLEGSAIRGSDYEEFGTSITIPEGDTRRSVQVQIIDDSVIERTETLYVIIEPDTSYNRSAEQEANVNIIDNDRARVTLNVSNTDVLEGNVITSLMLTSSSPAPYDIVVNLSISGDATAGADFETIPNALTIPAYQTFVTQSITLIEDEIVERDEEITITLMPSSTYEVSGTFEKTIRIENDDVLTASLAMDNTTGTEGTPEELRIVFDKQVSYEVPVSLYIDGTAERTYDYAALAEVFTMPPMETVLAIPITLIDDTVVENPETIIFTMEDSGSYRLGTTFEQVLTIADNDQPTVSLSAPLPHFYETGESVITLNLDKPAPYVISIPATYGGTATNGVDYTLLQETITIPAGPTSVQVEFSPIEDGLVEPIETILFGLQPGENYILSQSIMRLTLESGDLPEATISVTDNTTPERTGNVDFKVTLDKSTLSDLEVNLQLSGTADENTDFSEVTRTVTIPSGQRSAVFSVGILADNLVEGDETIQIILDAGVGYSIGSEDRQLLTITDDDSVTVSMEQSSIESLEASASQNLNILLSNPVASDLLINLSNQGTATSGTDFSVIPTSINVPAGQTSVALPISVINDNAVENTETIRVIIQSGNYFLGGIIETTLRILDDDKPEISLTQTISSFDEEGTAAPWTITMDAAAAYDIQVHLDFSGTATNAVDYSLISSPVTIPAGLTSLTMNFNPVNDNIVEFTETVVATITPDQAYSVSTLQNSVIFDLTDSDKPEAEWSLSSLPAVEGQHPVIDILLDRVSPVDTIIDYTVTGTATMGADFSDPGVVVIPAGETIYHLMIPIFSDEQTETEETIILSLNASGAVDLGSPATVTITVEDTNDPVVSFDVLYPVFTESGGTQNVVINLDSSAAYDIYFEVIPYGATDDIMPFTTDIVIPAGQASVVLPIIVEEDLLVEGDEILYLSFGLTSTIPLTFGQTAEVTIRDNDICVVDVAATTTSVVEASAMPFKLKLNQACPYPIQVPVIISGTATEGVDHNFASQTVTIPQGTSTFDLGIMSLSDTIDEPDETVIVTIGPSPEGNYTLGATTFKTVTIVDDDLPVFSLQAADSTAMEGGALSFYIKSSTLLGADTTVLLDYAGTLSSADFDMVNNEEFTFPAGTIVNHLVTLSVTDDIVTENTEATTVTLADTGDYSRQGTILLNLEVIDNDPPVFGISGDNITLSEEEGDTVKFILTLSQKAPYPIEIPITLSGTAQPGSIDYVGQTTTYLTVAAGRTSESFQLATLDDDLAEATETIIATLEPGDGYTIGVNSSCTYQLTDNDLPELTFEKITLTNPETGSNYYGAAMAIATRPLPYDMTIRFDLDGRGRSHHDSSTYSNTYFDMNGESMLDKTFIEYVMPAGSTEFSLAIEPNQFKYNRIWVRLVLRDPANYKLLGGVDQIELYWANW